jgi:hypothetical protein
MTTSSGLLKVGDLVILPDARRAAIVEISWQEEEPYYRVELDSGARLDVPAGDVIRARTYASWVAPESNWDGVERRKGQPGYTGPERRRP